MLNNTPNSLCMGQSTLRNLTLSLVYNFAFPIHCIRNEPI